MVPLPLWAISPSMRLLTCRCEELVHQVGLRVAGLRNGGLRLTGHDGRTMHRRAGNRSRCLWRDSVRWINGGRDDMFPRAVGHGDLRVLLKMGIIDVIDAPLEGEAAALLGEH